MKDNRNGIEFNRETGRYETRWGWIRLNFQTGDVEVYGPNVNEWFHADRAMQTAGLYAAHCPTPGMAVALAIHYQHAAWRGSRELNEVRL